MRRDVIFIVVLILFFMQQGCKKEVRNVDDTKGNLKRTETVKESFLDRIAIADSVMNNDSLQSKATRYFVASKQNLKEQKPEPDNYVLAPVEPYFSYGLRHSDQKEENTDVYYTNEGSSVLTDYYNSYSLSNSGYNNYYYYDEYYPVYSDNYFSWYYDNYYYFNKDYYYDYISPPVWNNKPNKPNRPNRPNRPKPPQKPDQIRPGHPGSTRPPQRPGPELPQRPDSPSIRLLPESVSGKENVNEERECREAETRRQREAQEREVQERQERERRESEARQQRETQERQQREVESSRQGGRR